jgi:hypothetical protein
MSNHESTRGELVEQKEKGKTYMTIVTANKELTIDQAREVSRQRRDLELAVADRRDDLEAQQESIDALSRTLRDPAAKTETQISGEIKRLHAIAEALAAAENELAEFDNKFPTEADLEALQKEAEQQAANAAYQEKLKAFKTNRTTAYGLLDQVMKLDGEAKTIRVGGMQGDEIANSLIMMQRLCLNRGIEPAGAISIMRGILDKL